jgi:hypothetical protein
MTRKKVRMLLLVVALAVTDVTDMLLLVLLFLLLTDDDEEEEEDDDAAGGTPNKGATAVCAPSKEDVYKAMHKVRMFVWIQAQKGKEEVVSASPHLSPPHTHTHVHMHTTEWLLPASRMSTKPCTRWVGGR